MEEKNNYNDFSDAEQMIDDFRQGSDLNEAERQLGAELQKILKYKNPIISIQHLAAFQTATLGYQNRKILIYLRSIKRILIFIAAIVFFWCNCNVKQIGKYFLYLTHLMINSTMTYLRANAESQVFPCSIKESQNIAPWFFSCASMKYKIAFKPPFTTCLSFQLW